VICFTIIAQFLVECPATVLPWPATFYDSYQALYRPRWSLAPRTLVQSAEQAKDVEVLVDICAVAWLTIYVLCDALVANPEVLTLIVLGASSRCVRLIWLLMLDAVDVLVTRHLVSIVLVWWSPTGHREYFWHLYLFYIAWRKVRMICSVENIVGTLSRPITTVTALKAEIHSEFFWLVDICSHEHSFGSHIGATAFRTGTEKRSLIL
jgi:hypothetical protein